MDEPMCAEEIYFFLKGAKQEEIDIIFEWALAAKRRVWPEWDITYIALKKECYEQEKKRMIASIQRRGEENWDQDIE